MPSSPLPQPIDEGDPDVATRRLAASPEHRDDPTRWFDLLYAAAGRGEAVVPWDRGTPNPLLTSWVQDRDIAARPGMPLRTIVVGAGYGRDSEYLASLGLPTTAFDISPTAVEDTRRRFPESGVAYETGDLLSLPDAWLGAFDLVVESMNVQALPQPTRARAIEGVSSLVAPGGTLLVIAFGHDGPPRARDAVEGPPWPLSRDEVESFAADGMAVVGIERFVDDDDPDVIRWRAELHRR